MSPVHPIGFGLYVGLANKSLAQLYDEVELAEGLGYDHCWLSDHLMPPAGPTDGACLEAWTLLAALAERTARIRLGVLVSSNTFRHPVVLAKQAVTVDHISGGRVILGIGTGWHPEEHRRYGIELYDTPTRVDRFAEAVELITRLGQDARATFDGRHYRLDDAPFQPPAIQRPRIPLLIAAHRPRMLRLAARFADIWDSYATIPDSANDGVASTLRDRIRALDAACRDIGRPSEEIRRSTWGTRDVLRSVDTYLAFVHENRALGFSDFTTVMPAPDNVRILRRIADDVMPELRASGHVS